MASPKFAPSKGDKETSVAETATKIEATDEELLTHPRVQELISAAAADAAAKAAQDAVDRIMGQMDAARAAAGTPAQPEDHSLARTLAMEIARISDQGTNRKRIAPEVLIAREEARVRMEGLLIEAHASGLVPEYELKQAVYLDEMLVAPVFVDRNHVQRATRIAWPQVPSEAMRPVNEVARAIFQQFLLSIGGATQMVGKEHDKSALKVLHMDQQRKTPQVGGSSRGDLKVLGRHQDGEIVETNVLGTVAAPARQIG